MNEKWKEVKDYEGEYEVSTSGRVRSVARSIIRSNGRPYTIKETVLSPHIHKDGYPRVSLHSNGASSTHTIHSLVASAFLDKPDSDSIEVNHKNGDKTDNRLDNLEYITKLDNIRHAHKQGFYPKNRNYSKGRNHHWSKLTPKIVNEIRTLYSSGDWTQVKLAEQFDLSQSHISDIVNRKWWKHT